MHLWCALTIWLLDCENLDYLFTNYWGSVAVILSKGVQSWADFWQYTVNRPRYARKCSLFLLVVGLLRDPPKIVDHIYEEWFW